MEKENDIRTLLYYTSLELERYQDMTQEVLNYINKHEDINEVKEIYDIIKKFAC